VYDCKYNMPLYNKVEINFVFGGLRRHLNTSFVVVV
jgi:hypothetical protein